MSCIRFNTPAQREQLRRMAPAKLTAEEAAALHPAPEWTDSKIDRLRRLAVSDNPKIRESVASSYHTPPDVMAKLAVDPDEGVRACVARNETVSCDILGKLVEDPSERVRGFLAINFFVPADAMAKLAEDPSPVVRDLAAWKHELAEQAHA